MSCDESAESSTSSPSGSPPPSETVHAHISLTHRHSSPMEQAAFLRRSFHKNPRLPGTHRLSKLNGSSRNSYADSESENDVPENAVPVAFARGSSIRQSIASMRSLPGRNFEAQFGRQERRRAIIPISTRMASRVLSNATGDLESSHIDCRDFTMAPPSPKIVPRVPPQPAAAPLVVEVPSFVTFKPSAYGRSSVCSSDDCSTSECSSSPHSTVRRAGVASSPDLLKAPQHWFKDPACRLSMSSQGSWFSDDEMYSMRGSGVAK